MLKKLVGPVFQARNFVFNEKRLCEKSADVFITSTDTQTYQYIVSMIASLLKCTLSFAHAKKIGTIEQLGVSAQKPCSF